MSKKGTKAWNKDLKGSQRAWNVGIPNSIETREKITAGLIGLFKGSKNPNAKSCSIDGSIYECMKDAMNTYSISKYTLRNRLNSEKFENWFYL